MKYTIKSVINWIGTGGKENQEAIKRLDRQKWDQFIHEAHKKPRKKRKKGEDGTVYSTLGQTSMSSFVSLNNTLY